MKTLAIVALTALLLAAPAAAGDEATGADEPKKPTNTLRWKTASEVDNFGFDVYRATSKDGPFTRITKKPIPGAGTTDTPTDYVWIDEAIDPTREYFYYVESITMGGAREHFTPVIRAPAKAGGDAAKPSSDG